MEPAQPPLGSTRSLSDGFIQAFMGSPTFDLKVVSWRQLVQAADRNRLDDLRFELQCKWTRSYHSILAAKGAEGTTEDIRTLEISIEVRSGQAFFSAVGQLHPDFEKIKDAAGFLEYTGPLSTNSISGPKPGSVKGWIFFGNDTLREISRLLTIQPEPELSISATFDARPTATPRSLVYDPKQSVHGDYRWDGNEWLEIKDATFVAGKAPVKTLETPAERDEPPTLTELRTIAKGIETLNANLTSRTMFILAMLVVGAILVGLWSRH